MFWVGELSAMHWARGNVAGAAPATTVMDFLHSVVDIALHLDQHLHSLIEQFGVWTYVILFAVLFMETGLVVTPFLPGDSLLFAAGAVAATGSLSVQMLFLLLCVAVLLGDSTNYWIGRFVGPKVFHAEKNRFFKREHLDRTHAFYERYGGKTVIMARFVPIVRTFAPFVAGIGRMRYLRFFTFSFLGTLAWISIFVFGGYFFGNLPVVKKNFTLVIFAIIGISILPSVVEFLRERARTRAASGA
jgi:membrane-associated protein